ncbi:MAG: hypothetical protein ACRD0G_09535 [Acidimicrobiales bacterium]
MTFSQSRGRGVLSCAGLIAATVASCGGDGDPDAVAAGSVVPGLEVGIGYPRFLQVEGTHLTVNFVNDGSEPLLVERLALRSPAFEELDAEDTDTTVRPGRRVDIRVGFGDARCDRDPAESAVEASLVHGETEWDGLLVVDDARLRQIWEDRCGERAIAEAVDIGFSEQFERVDGGVLATLTAERADDAGEVRIEAMRGSVILTTETTAAAGEPLATLTDEQPAAAIDVEIAASRCEPHAVIESKKTFEFAVWVTAGEYEAEHVVVRATGPLRDELQAVIDECVERFAAATGG